MVDLYRTRLGWRVDDPYETLNSTVSRNWSWGRGLGRPEALGDLAQMLALDPNYRVLVAHGLDGRAGAIFRDRPGTRPTAAVRVAGSIDVRRLSRRPHVLRAATSPARAFRDEARRMIEGK